MNIKTMIVPEENFEAISLKYAIDEGRRTEIVSIDEAKKILE
jgi:hypothetical protein